MYNIIALMGESGSGKDTVLKEMLIQHPELHKIISSTSRPKREKEVEGINYHYYTDDEFLDKIINREMIEFSIFNNWKYGTEIKALDEDKINVGVFNPQAIRSLLIRDDCFVFVVWVRTSDKERLLR
jgi:guanylate kinase